MWHSMEEISTWFYCSGGSGSPDYFHSDFQVICIVVVTHLPLENIRSIRERFRSGHLTGQFIKFWVSENILHFHNMLVYWHWILNHQKTDTQSSRQKEKWAWNMSTFCNKCLQVSLSVINNLYKTFGWCIMVQSNLETCFFVAQPSREDCCALISRGRL